MADRSVALENTFADFRDTFIATCTDIGDISTLNNSFTGTATDLVEACNKSPSQGLTIGLCVALG